MARNLREGINQINQDLDELGEMWQESRIGGAFDKATERGINTFGRVIGAPFAIYQRVKRKKEKEKKQVPKKKAKGGVVTGKKRSGPRGVGCAKRGYGKALS